MGGCFIHPQHPQSLCSCFHVTLHATHLPPPSILEVQHRHLHRFLFPCENAEKGQRPKPSTPNFGGGNDLLDVVQRAGGFSDPNSGCGSRGERDVRDACSSTSTHRKGVVRGVPVCCFSTSEITLPAVNIFICHIFLSGDICCMPQIMHYLKYEHYELLQVFYTSRNRITTSRYPPSPDFR